MKKFVSLMLAFMVAVMMVPAVAEESPVGTWYLESVAIGEVVMSAAMFGQDMTMTLNEDGTAVLVNGTENEQAEGTWVSTENGIEVTVQNSAMLFTIDGETLTADMDGMGTMIMTRNEPDPAASLTPEIIPAESEADFLGTWEAKRIDIQGQILPLEILSMMGFEVSMTVTITEGSGTLNMSITMLGSEEGSQEIPEVPCPTAFADGVLTITIPGIEQPVEIRKTNTDELFIQLSSGEMDLPMYFSRVAAE